MGIKTFKLTKGELNGQFLKTFQIHYENPLSLTARNILTRKLQFKQTNLKHNNNNKKKIAR